MRWRLAGSPCRRGCRTMDRTLKRAKRNNKRRGQRNHGAWRRFSPDGTTCRYCPHDGSKHLCRSGQPHFFRPATEAEERDSSVMLYRHRLPSGGSVLVWRMTVANRAELITAFCNPEPCRFGPNTTTDSQEKGETT